MNGLYKQGWNEDRLLLKKLVEVYLQVEYIQKRGHNKFHNYKYATEADVNEKVREEISKRNVIMMPNITHKEMRTTTTKSGNTEYIYRVDMDFTFMDAESGESLTVQMSGEGQDVGDKAIFKAISGCQKYALMKAFMIPTGDDPEGDEGVDERNHNKPPARPAQQPQQQPNTNVQPTNQTSAQGNTSGAELATENQVKMLRAKRQKAGLEGMEAINKYLGINAAHMTEVPRSKVNDLIKFLDSQAIPA